MPHVSRREFLFSAAAAIAGLSRAGAAEPERPSLHQQILDRAAELEKSRRERFAALKTRDDLAALQQSLRETFLQLLDGLPAKADVPVVRKTGRIESDGYTIDKLAYASFPDYWVPALLYRPAKLDVPAPAVISPCGHSTVGKAADTYQILHVNLARRGFVVLTYDPVGQGERSQFWDAVKGRSRFNLSCGEHAVLGNPLYLLGTSLARYRIWDGMRGIDYLSTLEEVDPKRIGCVGNSGGGTLTAYITALDPRVAAAVIGCYITTLRRRMGNRIELDPDADPEQDIYRFVEHIDHAGLLALCTPRPTLVAAARRDFFPIEGARESVEEARHLYTVAGVPERVAIAEADDKHGLTLPLRKAAYAWLERWLAGRKESADEIPVTPRPPKDLLVCGGGQVSVAFKSRHLLPLALAEFRTRPKRPHASLKDVLRLDPESAAFRETVFGTDGKAGTVLLVNGNEAPDWREDVKLVQELVDSGRRVRLIDPRGVGQLRPALQVKGRDYVDPLAGVEENLAYNAFLVGRSLLGMRVADVLAAVAKEAGKVTLCARRDAALVALFAAALEPRIARIALEEMRCSYWPPFDEAGVPINAASLLPGLLRDFGDLPDVLAEVAPRPILLAAPVNAPEALLKSVRKSDARFSADPKVLLDWL
jgi:pimeloyl-ACP methyl ester carboxylesterase